VSFGAKPMGPPPMRPRPPSRGETAFAVGSRALITPSSSGNATAVQLLDEDGMPTTLSLPANATVVITAWRPRRSAPPRYRVCTPEKVEGWIDAANLRRLPPPPPPPPSIASSAPAPVAAKPGKGAAVKASAAKPVAAKPVAAKPAVAKAAPKVPEKAAAVKPAAKPAAAKPAPKAAKPVAKTKARPASAARSKPKAPAGKTKSSRPAPKRAR
jgi:hypothetical protein